jgi:hypothetical protein
MVDFGSLDATISKVLLRLAAQERGISIQPIPVLSSRPTAQAEQLEPAMTKDGNSSCATEAAGSTPSADSALEPGSTVAAAAGAAACAQADDTTGHGANAAPAPAAATHTGAEHMSTTAEVEAIQARPDSVAAGAAVEADAAAAAAAAAVEADAAAAAVEAGPGAGLLNWEAEQVLRQPVGYVCLLGVAPECRRQGLGKALLDNAVRFARANG